MVAVRTIKRPLFSAAAEGKNVKKPVSDTYLAAVFAAVVGAIFTWAGSDFWADLKPLIGVPLVDLLRILVFLGFAAFSFAVLHYFGVLGAGAEPVDTRERNEYDALRQRIAAGNWIAREYARRLNVFLDAIDRFFGDEGMADRTLFPHAFGLRKPAALWTARAFDRCLSLALIYPIAAIILIWTISNHVGPAEAALLLQSTSGWKRSVGMASIALSTYGAWLLLQSAGRRQFLFGGAMIVASLMIFNTEVEAGVATAAFSTAGFAILLVVAVDRFRIGFSKSDPSEIDAISVLDSMKAKTVLIAGGSILNAFMIGLAFMIPIAAIGLVKTRIVSLPGGTMIVQIVAGSIVVMVPTFIAAFALAVSKKFIKVDRHGTFLSIFFLFMVLLCFCGATILSPLRGWRLGGPVLMFFGLLTLINAPFDWFALGLTRALMRRGLEREKWWPYFYAAVDALFAAIVIAILTVTMVAGVQLFDDLAVHGGGERLLPPMQEYLDAIKADPGKPEYWWVYATLFSTMLPSLINLFVAGVSLARGIPGISSWLLSKVREGEAVPAYDRLLVAIVLSLQGILGLAIALAAQGFLFWVIIWQGMPRLGIGVLDLAYLVAH